MFLSVSFKRSGPPNSTDLFTLSSPNPGISIRVFIGTQSVIISVFALEYLENITEFNSGSRRLLPAQDMTIFKSLPSLRVLGTSIDCWVVEVVALSFEKNLFFIYL